MSASDSGTDVGERGPRLQQLKELLRSELIAILDTIRGAKALVLDRDVSAALSAVVDFAALKEHGVEKMYLLETGAGDAPVQGVVYLVQPNVRKLRLVAEQVRAGSGREHSVQLVPRRTLLGERVLEEAGVLGDVTLGELRLDAVPLDDDVVSLEQPGMFAALYLDGDFSGIQSVARALMRLQGLWGFFPRIVGKGDYAQMLAHSLERMRAELGAGSAGDALALSSAFDAAVVVDRAADVATPLLTQLTYEGLVSEVFGIVGGAVAGGDAKGARVAASGDDAVYRAIRDVGFADVGALLGAMTRQLQTSYESRHQARTVQEIRSFVGRLGGLQAEHQALKAHVAVAEAVLRRTQSDDFGALLDIEQTLVAGADLDPEQRAYVDRVLALADTHAYVPGVDTERRDPPAPAAPNSLHKVLRILCLCALWRGPALKQKTYDAWYDEIVAAFGAHHTITLDNLARVGLLPPPSAARSQPGSAHANPRGFLRKALNLAVADDADDVAYAYAGYAPLSVRLLQVLTQDPAVHTPAASSRYAALLRPLADRLATQTQPATPQSVGGVRGGWAGWEDVLAEVPGATVDIMQTPAADAADARAQRLGVKAPATLVVFLGGCTSAEIAALRRLSQQHGHRYVVATTQILNGNSFLDPLIQHR
ncbi:Vacuolar protein-sorting-associated protein 33 [Coemansia sp. RSA 1972]|nr:Vacuolar protein-sorting-associated protein 33 [Coemansia sp. RSA 1972]